MPELSDAAPDSPAGGRPMMLASLLLMVAGTVGAVLLSRNDLWDRSYDLPLYGLLLAVMSLLAWAMWSGRLTLDRSAQVLTGAGAVFLGAKLVFLGTAGVAREVVLQEITESLSWLAPVMAWALVTSFTEQMRRLLGGLLGLVALLSAALVLQRSLADGMLDRDLLRVALQLNLAAWTVYYGTGFLLRRVSALSQLQSEQQTLRRLAYHDLLTGLPGRLSLEQRLRELTHPVTQRFALLFVDVDSFKVINDTLGHAAGDQLLQALGSELARVAGEAAQVYRLSGDEFVVLLPGATAEQAERTARQIQEEATRLPSARVGVETTLSIGLSLCPEDARTPGELLRHADSAMYAVKRSGRRHVRRYQPEQHAATERFQLLSRDLGHALTRGELQVYYQPIVSLTDGEIVKIEALARWQHPELGAIGPSEFIPVAERVGLITPIGLWVLEQACRDLTRLPGLRVSVNVSGLQLMHRDFVPGVLDVLDANGVPPGQLEVELTETTLLHEDERAATALRALQAHGVKVALDDFGAGYSNLTRLRDLPISHVKLDRSFMSGFQEGSPEECRQAVTLLRAVLEMARSLNVSVTAEGLETPALVRLAMEMGCDLGQGYGLGHPMPVSDLSEMVSAQPLGELGRGPASEPLGTVY
ncbi:putative bifunctional diguanylate cyclase/phosphodiesterase [Deinococcus navajonensis]|uniref:Bifunctional diguanylate cyclase/phosphodiesterase n=1 Tax=Deinococcus navajonensis TaxID=309884 RepID=A0ABV8XMD6_9DEIO